VKIETQWAFDWRNKKKRKRQVLRWLPGNERGSEIEAMRVASALCRKHGASVAMQAIDRKVV
jgi:hypothetical protein